MEERASASGDHIHVALSSWVMEMASPGDCVIGSSIQTVPEASYCPDCEKLKSRFSKFMTSRKADKCAPEASLEIVNGGMSMTEEGTGTQP